MKKSNAQKHLFLTEGKFQNKWVSDYAAKPNSTMDGDKQKTGVKTLKISFKGAPKDTRLGILRVMTLDGKLIFQKLQDASENATFSVKVPAHTEEVMLTFGDLKEVFDARHGAIVLKWQ